MNRADVAVPIVYEDLGSGAMLASTQRTRDRFNALARHPWMFLSDESRPKRTSPFRILSCITTPDVTRRQLIPNLIRCDPRGTLRPP